MGAAPAAVAVDEPARRVFVAKAGANSVRVLNARTGATVRTVPVGAAPTAVAVDVPTARVFVANAGDDSVSLLDVHSGALLRTVRVGTGPQGGPRAVAVAARAGARSSPAAIACSCWTPATGRSCAPCRRASAPWRGIPWPWRSTSGSAAQRSS